MNPSTRRAGPPGERARPARAGRARDLAPSRLAGQAVAGGRKRLDPFFLYLPLAVLADAVNFVVEFAQRRVDIVQRFALIIGKLEQDLLVQAQLCNQPLQLAVLPLQLLQPLQLARTDSVVLPPPQLDGLVANAVLASDLLHGNA